MNSKERLREVIDDIKFTERLTNEALAKALGYQPTYISDILGGKTITDLFLKRMNKCFQVNPEYIKEGKGNAYSRIIDNSEQGKATRTLLIPRQTDIDPLATIAESNKILAESNIILAKSLAKVLNLNEQSENEASGGILSLLPDDLSSLKDEDLKQLGKKIVAHFQDAKRE